MAEAKRVSAETSSRSTPVWKPSMTKGPPPDSPIGKANTSAPAVPASTAPSSGTGALPPPPVPPPLPPVSPPVPPPLPPVSLPPVSPPVPVLPPAGTVTLPFASGRA